MGYGMKHSKKNKNQTDFRIILTKPETIFNNKVARIYAEHQGISCTAARKILKGILAFRQCLEEDRSRLCGFLIDCWRQAVANVGGLANMIMQTPGGIDTDDKYVDSVLAPYCTFNNFMTGVLIDNMTCAEEDELTITSGYLKSNWSKFFSVIEARGISAPETIGEAETLALSLNYHITEIYHSCEKPVVDANWLNTYDALEKSLKTILKDLAAYDPMKAMKGVSE